jgi:hypothetical protein
MSNGKFVCFEYGANDVATGLSIYRNVVGWDSIREEMPTGWHELFMLAETPRCSVTATKTGRAAAC